MSFFSNIFSALVKISRFVLGQPELPDVFIRLLSILPQAILDSVNAYKEPNEQTIRQLCKHIDDHTGLDQDAIDVMRTLPASREEEFFDHLTELLFIMAMNKCKQPTYYEPPKNKG